MSNRRFLQKQLTYRAQAGANVQAHTAHWRDFTWTSGPVMVTSEGPWGKPQVWASSEGEGKRVLRHAGSIAGVDVDDPQVCQWHVRAIGHPRFQRQVVMGLRSLRGLEAVSSRDGPDGAPEWDG